MPNRVRLIAQAIAVCGVLPVALAAGGIALNTATTAHATPVPAPVAPPTPSLFRTIFNDPTTPACQYEDGSELLDAIATEDPKLEHFTARACRWDASTAGNGIGDSFVVITSPDPRGGGAELIYVYADDHVER